MAIKESKSPRTLGRASDEAIMVAHVQARHERERAQLSRMLHRDVAGMLAAVRMDLSRIAARVTDDDSQEQLRRVDLLIDQVIRDARREMQRLRPALLDHFGLSLALRHLIEETCRPRGIRYTMSLDETVDGVDPEVMIATFRLVEALLGDGAGIVEVHARLATRRDTYVLEFTRTAAPEPPASDVSESPFDLESLRAWLTVRGVSCSESIAADDGTTTELRIPRELAAQKSETPGG